MNDNAPALEVASGRGFDFEDCVAAEFLLGMLTGHHPLGPQFGEPCRVRWQTGRDLGWRLDDILVEFASNLGTIQVAISCRSGREVTRNGFKPDFVEGVWHHWLNPLSPAFDKGRDLFCLVTGELADSVQAHWNQLLTAALNVDADRAVGRLNTPCRTILKSLRCPNRQAEAADEETWTLTSHIRLLKRDFFHTPSQSLASLASSARRAVTSGSDRDAQRLWDQLLIIAKRNRRDGADFRRPQLLAELRAAIALTEHPNHSPDLAILDRLSLELADDVHTTIGRDAITLERAIMKTALIESMQSFPIVVVRGESGTGKSALVRNIAREGNRRLIWLNADLLRHASTADFEQAIGLRHSLDDLLINSATPCVVVFDAVERCCPVGRSLVRKLITRLRQWADSTQIAIVLTCQTEAWDGMGSEFLEETINPESVGVINVAFLTAEETAQIIQQIPNLQHPSIRSTLGRLARNIKFLDWIVDAAARLGSAGIESCVGLTPLIDWLWHRWIGNDPGHRARARVLQRIAEQEATGLLSGAALSDLSTDELDRVEAMERDGLMRVRNERVRFSHDLLGDCARLRLLIGDDPTATEEKQQQYSTPQWHKGVRLYGQWLLESDADGLSKWRAAMQRCNPTSQSGRICRDLMLEAILLSAVDGALWERAWPELTAHDGEHLNRLLNRARLVATDADPRVLRNVTDRDVAEYLSVSCRIPRFEYWSLMLRVLRNHADDVVRVARTEAARVCQLWLESMPPRWDDAHAFPLRREAAELAVAIAREVQGLLAEGEHFSDREERPEFRALLAAAPDLPDEVSELALQLANRHEPSPAIVERAAQHLRRQEGARRQREADQPGRQIPDGRSVRDMFHFGELLPPWPDGPGSDVADAFRNVVLSPNAIVPLLQCRAQVAVELLLAVCIDPPKAAGSTGYRDAINFMSDVGLESWPAGHPPMFFRGPFLRALQIDAINGMDAIVRLVNFATERYCEREQRIHVGRAGEPSLRMAIEVALPDGGHRVWHGDWRSYGWYRETFTNSSILVAALMALEKWLYDLCDENLESAKLHLQRLVQASRSVAFAGLMAAVGKRHPTLLEDVLQPLFSAWQILEWDRKLVMEGTVWQIGMMSWSRYGEETLDRVRAWHLLPHRSHHLLDDAVKMFLTHEGTRKAFGQTRKYWQTVRDNGEDDKTLSLLIERFNIENYKVQPLDDHTFQVSLSWPESMRAENELAAERADEMTNMLTFPYRCRKALTTDTPIPETDLSAFCEEIRVLANYRAPNAEDAHRRADAVTGGIAVLAILHPQWLKSNEELNKWCCDQVGQVLESPPQELPWSIPESATDTHWQGFVGEVTVFEFAETPNDDLVRALLVQLAASHLYATTAIMFRRAFRIRSRLGPEFDRFVNLIAFLAGLWHVAQTCRGWEIRSDYPNKAWRRLCRAFADGQIPSTPLKWSKIAQFATTRVVRVQRIRFPQAKLPIQFHQFNDDRHVGRNDPGFDIQFLKYVFDQLPQFNRSWGLSERQQYLRIIHELLSVSMRMLPDLSEGEELEGTPFEFDHCVFEIIAKTVARLGDTSAARELWQPILILGPRYHDWVDAFLADWMIHGVRAAESKEEFVARWREMLAFALSQSDWSGHWRVDDLAAEICGLNYGGTTIGDDNDFAPLLEQMIPLLAQAAAKWFRRISVAHRFARFLSRPAARRLIPDGLSWLWDSVSQLDNHGWEREDAVERDLIAALRAGWQHCSERITKDATVRDAFLGILNKLTSRQNHAAIALRDRVLSAFHV